MIEYKFEPENYRSAAYEQEKMIGACEYTIQEGKWYIMHTVVDPVYQGKGIARQLVMDVVEHAEKKGIDVVPICSYAVKILK